MLAPNTPTGIDGDPDAIEIGQLYRKAKHSLIESVRYPIECGRKLKAKKDDLGHGNWLPWLAANAEVLGFNNDSTARRLMSAWKSWRKRYPTEETANRALAHDLNDLKPELLAQMSRETWGHEAPNGNGPSRNQIPPPLIDPDVAVLVDTAMQLAGSDVVLAHIKSLDEENVISREQFSEAARAVEQKLAAR